MDIFTGHDDLLDEVDDRTSFEASTGRHETYKRIGATGIRGLTKRFAEWMFPPADTDHEYALRFSHVQVVNAELSAQEALEIAESFEGDFSDTDPSEVEVKGGFLGNPPIDPNHPDHDQILN